ncbi:MAG: hypothetical protein GY870_20570, partial [archaeon]|nr:hypothetical protein [archaeon]
KIDDKYLEVGEQSVRAITKIGKAAMAKTFLLKPKNEMVQKMIKNNFKSKKEIAQGLIEATELETDPIKREKLKTEIQKLFGPK